MGVFVAVAEAESFAGAARRLHMSPPAVTRAIASLEQSLGIKLFNRTTRIVRTTEAGARYLEDARRILADVVAADEAAVGINTAPSGALSVTAPQLFGQRFVLPGVVEYLQRYPHTRITAVYLDRVVNLLEEGFDVGVRIGALADSSMRARRVGSVRTVLCASPEYLAQYGVPQVPDDLAAHTLINVGGLENSSWRFFTNSVARNVRIQPRLAVTTNGAGVRAAELGFGLSRHLSYQVAREVSEGRLVRVLEAFEPPASPHSYSASPGSFYSQPRCARLLT